MIITPRRKIDTKNCTHYNLNCIITIIETFSKSIVILSIFVTIRSRLVIILELDC